MYIYVNILLLHELIEILINQNKNTAAAAIKLFRSKYIPNLEWVSQNPGLNPICGKTFKTVIHTHSSCSLTDKELFSLAATNLVCHEQNVDSEGFSKCLHHTL